MDWTRQNANNAIGGLGAGVPTKIDDVIPLELRLIFFNFFQARTVPGAT